MTTTRLPRFISFSEIDTLLTCPARWSFRYGGHLTDGDALEPKTPHVRLRDGKAWGVGVAEFHDREFAGRYEPSRLPQAIERMHEQLSADYAELRKLGVGDQEESFGQSITRLTGILTHYAHTVDPLGVFDLEREILVSVPSRTGSRASNKYRFQAFVDGLCEVDGRLWIVEFKLRGQLSDLQQVVMGRQYRWYAWALEQELGREVAGVIVDERLNAAPKAPKVNKDGRTSHDKRQQVTVEAYVESCLVTGTEPDPESADAFAQRRWHQQHRVMFRRAEIHEAGRELASAGVLIHQYDSGWLHPLRAPSKFKCPGCAYREICPNTEDRSLIDLLYVRKPPKRLRDLTEETKGISVVAA